MKLGFKYLTDLLTSSNKSEAELAETLGITLQAIQQWKSTNTIPSKRVSQLAEIFNLDSKGIESLLGIEPLSFNFRTKKTKEHLSAELVSERVYVRSHLIYEWFFKHFKCDIHYDFSAIMSAAVESDYNFEAIANAIRQEFTIPNYRPITSDELYEIQDRIGVKSFLLPFKQIGLNIEQENDQTGMLFRKGKSHTILLDSDRTVDEAHFDKVHELLHIFLNGLAIKNDKIEKTIDLVCGDLIYPKKFIIEKFFDGDQYSKPIKNKNALIKKFKMESSCRRHILSPRGLARAMRDFKLTTRNSELYKFLYSEFHSAYRDNAVTYSTYEGMDFNFSDRDAVLKFYESVVDKIENANLYPLFTYIKNSLINGELSPSDFADAFGLKHSEGILIKTIWQNKVSDKEDGLQ